MPYFNRSNLNSSAHETDRETNQMWQVFANERQTFAAPKIHSLNPADKDYSCDHCKYKTDFKAYLDHHKKRIHMSQPGLWMCMTGTCRGNHKSPSVEKALTDTSRGWMSWVQEELWGKTKHEKACKKCPQGTKRHIWELKWLKCGRKFEYWPIDLEVWRSISWWNQSNKILNCGRLRGLIVNLGVKTCLNVCALVNTGA